MARRLWGRQGNPCPNQQILAQKSINRIINGRNEVRKNDCSEASLFTGKKELRTWSNRTELSLRETQYQLHYRRSWTAIALVTPFQNIIKETYKEKQLFNLCSRTGSVYHAPKSERQIEACPVAALHYLPPLCGHFDPMWSTKRALKLSLLIILGYGTRCTMVSLSSLLLTWVPHIINPFHFPRMDFLICPIDS